MKCVYCGEELKEGSLFCSHCGKPVEMVSEYNVYEEDYLKQMLKDENRPGSTQAKSRASKQAAAAQRDRKQIIVILAIAGVILAIVIGLVIVGIYRVKSSQSESFMYQIQMAEEAYGNGDIDAAIGYYERALWLDNDNNKIRMILANIYMERKDYDSVVLLCREALYKDKTNREACEMLISIYEQRKDYDSVLLLYDLADKSLANLFSAYVVTPPVFSREEGTYRQYMTVEILTGKDYVIYYSTDGSDPTLHGELYTKPIELNRNLATVTIKAACMNEKGIFSEIVSKEYTIDLAAPNMPVVTPGGGNFTEETLVEIMVPEGCTAFYTWDGSDPNINSEQYREPIAIPEGNNILSAILIDNVTELSSDIFRGNYVYYPDVAGGTEDAQGEGDEAISGNDIQGIEDEIQAQ